MVSRKIFSDYLDTISFLCRHVDVDLEFEIEKIKQSEPFIAVTGIKSVTKIASFVLSKPFQQNH